MRNVHEVRIKKCNGKIRPDPPDDHIHNRYRRRVAPAIYFPHKAFLAFLRYREMFVRHPSGKGYLRLNKDHRKQASAPLQQNRFGEKKKKRVSSIFIVGDSNIE